MEEYNDDYYMLEYLIKPRHLTWEALRGIFNIFYGSSEDPERKLFLFEQQYPNFCFSLIFCGDTSFSEYTWKVRDSSIDNDNNCGQDKISTFDKVRDTSCHLKFGLNHLTWEARMRILSDLQYTDCLDITLFDFDQHYPEFGVDVEFFQCRDDLLGRWFWEVYERSQTIINGEEIDKNNENNNENDEVTAETQTETPTPPSQHENKNIIIIQDSVHFDQPPQQQEQDPQPTTVFPDPPEDPPSLANVTKSSENKEHSNDPADIPLPPSPKASEKTESQKNSNTNTGWGIW